MSRPDRAEVDPPGGPTVEDDPPGAWRAARDAIQAALEDPDVAARSFETPMGRSTFEQTVGMFGVGDVLVHTWDLARPRDSTRPSTPRRSAGCSPSWSPTTSSCGP